MNFQPKRQRKKRKTYISSIRNEGGNIITEPPDIKMVDKGKTGNNSMQINLTKDLDEIPKKHR